MVLQERAAEQVTDVVVGFMGQESHLTPESLVSCAWRWRWFGNETNVGCHCHSSFHVQRVTHDQHLLYAVAVCELLCIKNVLVRGVRFLFDQNVVYWNASLQGVLPRG